MELFAITCTTCKSRLKVRDPAAIGQILSCPKCGGMVMVKPPPAFSEIGEQKSDLPTATEVEGQALRFGETPNHSAFDVLDELLSDAPPRVKTPPPKPAATPPPAPPGPPKPRFVGGPPVHRSATPPNAKLNKTPSPGAPAVARSKTPAVPAQPITSPAVAPQKAAPAPNAAPAAPDPPVRGKQWNGTELLPPPPAEQVIASSKGETAATAARPRNNYWLLMVGSIVLGIGLALIAVCAVILLRPTGQPRASAPATTKKSAALPKKQARASTSAPIGSPSAAATTNGTRSVPTTGATVTPTENAQQPVVATTDGTRSVPATGDDPLGLTTAPTPAASTAPTTPTTDALAKFDRIIGGVPDDPPAKSAASPPDVPAPAAVDTTPARPLAPRPPQRDIDVTKRLADSLPGIETPGTPLAEFVQLMSDLSTIPITLEVPFPPATPGSAIVFKATNTTVGKALSEALATLRLEYVISNDQLIVRRPEPSPFAVLTQEVKDLTKGDEQQLNDLAELLQAVVEPGSWGEGEGLASITADAAKGTLAIRHRRAVQFQVLIALEKLRATRSPPLAPKAKVDPTLFQIDSRLKQAGPRLVKRLSLNYGQPTKLLTILDRLGATCGVRILVDWHDVAAAGWNPAAEATLVASNQPLEAALDSLLTPLDLTWRIIDAQTLQVVTPARLAERGELEFYKVADLIGGDPGAEALIAKTREALGNEAFVAGGGNGEIRYDEESKCLLAWLPQPKQRELEVLLAILRGGAVK